MVCGVEDQSCCSLLHPRPWQRPVSYRILIHFHHQSGLMSALKWSFLSPSGLPSTDFTLKCIQYIYMHFSGWNTDAALGNVKFTLQGSKAHAYVLLSPPNVCFHTPPLSLPEASGVASQLHRGILEISTSSCEDWLSVEPSKCVIKVCVCTVCLYRRRVCFNLACVQNKAYFDSSINIPFYMQIINQNDMDVVKCIVCILCSL